MNFRTILFLWFSALTVIISWEKTWKLTDTQQLISLAAQDESSGGELSLILQCTKLIICTS